jgi:hypothetical protein
VTRPIPPGLESVARIIDSFVRPGFDKLGTYHDYLGPYSGNNTITQWSETPGPVFTNWNVASSFGVVVNPVGAIPEGWGYRNGWVDEPTAHNCVQWEPPFGKLYVQTRLANGFYLTTSIVTLDVFPHMEVWIDAPAARLGLYVAPNIALDLFFLSWAIPLP